MATIREGQSHDTETVPATLWSPVTAVGVGEFLSGSALGYVLLTRGMTSVALALVVSSYLLALSLPIVLYRDYRTLEQAGIDWEIDLARYIAGAMIGVALYLVSLGVAALYLVQRYRRASRV